MQFNVAKVSAVLGGSAMVALPMVSAAGVTVYDEGDKYAEIGGRMQVQYKHVDPDTSNAESTDDLFLRRLRLYVEGSVTKDIMGKWQVDFGSDGEDAETKDAYIKYTGLGFADLVVGNHYVPFSREVLTSSKRQQFVERTFVGDHNYGVPDRQIGASLASQTDLFGWQVGVFKAGIDGSTSKVDFESPVSQPNDDENFYTGNLVGGRVDFAPVGKLEKMAQGAFGADTSLNVGLNAFTWSNDDDVPNPDGNGTGDEYDDITGYGIDAAFRTGYLSVDAAYQSYSAETVDSNLPRQGIIQSSAGEAEFDTAMIKAGYMVLPNRFEAVAGYSTLDVDGIKDEDRRVSIGGNVFLNEHKDKIQVTYEIGSNVIADDGNTAFGDDQNRVFVQWQHVL